ncbi:RNA polymerase sigma-70 factor [Nocardia huaxiensis]|uniref:RNA polymerase sigma-70 factor n=1 Tax=Nocardia huaxiensis TaxID=2755382 RepID=A0A7D6VE25_9NOCA|nr:RNA polymerase sigma-70 factor [Nocardia huaxiensis]QLY30677.1 RNA polymerase sigma-70 factor [Nocardia huaxiensis]UFS94168.1 RNA polymerase sigma-70 factor [Nocardia huaxiensis]
MDSDGLMEFERHRPRLFALAYRMLGSASEAEDAVQESYLRWDATARDDIRSPEAWLTTVVVNQCRTWLDSARARRETYVGPWLPEPVPTAHGELGPLESAEQRELVSIAFLTLLERLTAAERAVFVLREAFGYAHKEIADMLDLTEANSQQLYRRAAQRVRMDRPRFDPAPAHARALLDKFLTAARSGDVAGLEAMFTSDITSTADGGANVRAARRAVEGANKVARYLIWLFTHQVDGLEITIEEVNGAPAIVARVHGTPILVAAIETTNDLLHTLHLQVNPDKLALFRRAEAPGT